MLARTLFYTQNRAFDPDAQAYFTAAGVTDLARMQAWNTFVLGAKQDGFWDNLFVIKPYCIGTTASANIVNAKNPSVFTATLGGTLTHGTNGITGSTTGFVNSNFVQTTGGWTTISAGFGFYSRTNALNNGISMGGLGTYCYPRINIGVPLTLYTIGNGTYNQVASADSLGLFSIDRTAGVTSLYKRGALLASATVACTLSAVQIDTFCYPQTLNGSRAEFDNRTLALDYISTGMTAAKIANLEIRVTNLMTTLGINV